MNYAMKEEQFVPLKTATSVEVYQSIMKDKISIYDRNAIDRLPGRTAWINKRAETFSIEKTRTFTKDNYDYAEPVFKNIFAQARL